MVVFLFLRNVWATLIPSVAVPLSLLGTFGIMYLCGYSLDNLSLMALTISTGLRGGRRDRGDREYHRAIWNRACRPCSRALKGSAEIGFTVLSMSTSLIAVFIPILLMGGIVGRLFREFAVTLSAAIAVSLVVSLTTTPMMCAKFLQVAARPQAWLGLSAGRARFRWDAGLLRPHADGGAAASAAHHARDARDHRGQHLSLRDCSEGLLSPAGYGPNDRARCRGRRTFRFRR